MVRINLKNQAPLGVTTLSNTFIDDYMPKANGEYVKTYLYLLRLTGSQRTEELTMAQIADALECSSRDVIRALNYWESLGLVSCTYTSQGELASLCFLDLSSAVAPTTAATSSAAFGMSEGTTVSPAAGVSQGTTVSPAAGMTEGTAAGMASAVSGAAIETTSAPASGDASASKIVRMPQAAERGEISLSLDQKESLSRDPNVQQILYIAEQYLQHPLSMSEMETLMYFYDALHFDVDLMDYLIEYCVTKGSTSIHYISKVAFSWADQGIRSAKEAKQSTKLYSRRYSGILKAFGISRRDPGAKEAELIEKWIHEYPFEQDIILEACNRTMRAIHEPSFEYADSILRAWLSAGVTSLADIEALDAKRAKTKNKKTAKASGTAFNNFTGRDYDFDELERLYFNADQ